MAGSYVFPGGRVDDGDQPPPGAPLPPAVFRDLSDAEEAAYRTAAVRELQEEANVSITVDDLHAVRALGHAGDRDPPLRHAVLPGADAGRADAEARRGRDDRARVAVAARSDRAIRAPRAAAAAADLDHASASWRTRTSIEDVLAWARSRPIVRVMPGFFKNGDRGDADAAGRSAVSDDSRLGSAGRNPIRAARRSAMATRESLTADIDRVIAYFNARRLDLPDGFFDRRTQFVINGAPFETLLGTRAERSADPDAGARAGRLSIHAPRRCSTRSRRETRTRRGDD